VFQKKASVPVADGEKEALKEKKVKTKKLEKAEKN